MTKLEIDVYQDKINVHSSLQDIHEICVAAILWSQKENVLEVIVHEIAITNKFDWTKLATKNG